MSAHLEEKLRRGFENINRGDLTAASDDWDEDIIFHFPGNTRLSKVYRGKEAVEGVFWKLQQLMPGVRIEVTRIIAWKNVGVVQWVKQSKSLDGQRFENPGITIFEFRNDKVVAMRDYLDTERLALLFPPTGTGRK